VTDELKRWFITVDYCKEGHRGIFCSRDGSTPVQDHEHTYEELWEALDCFYLILDPKSEAFTEKEAHEYHLWTPLPEYMNVWGILRKEETNDTVGNS